MMKEKKTALIWVMLILCQEVRMEPIVEPGPSSGILIQEAPGFILTGRRLTSQKIFVSVDPQTVIERQFNISNIQMEETKVWYHEHIDRSQATVKEMLEQLRKTFIPESYNSNSRRPKRFIGFLIGAAIMTILGAVIGTTMSVANSVSIETLNKESRELRDSLKMVQRELELQKQNLNDLITVVNETIVTTNLHSKLISHSIDLHRKYSISRVESLFFREPVTFITTNFFREIQDCITSLIHGRIPLYFVNNDIVRNMFAKMYHQEVDHMQIRVAFEMGSAIPLFIDSEKMELGFLLTVPFIMPEHVYQIKTVYNVGTWKDGIHLQIQVPSMLAYQAWINGPYLIPDVSDCVVFKDLNYLCPGKPFVHDATHALCGVNYMMHEFEKCQVVMSKSEDLISTKAMRVQNKWLVSTSLTNMSISYPAHGTFTVMPLAYRVSFIKVPRDTVITIGEVTLFYIDTSIQEGEVEIIDAFQNQDIPIDTDLKFLLDHKPNHTIDMVIRKNNITIDNQNLSSKDMEIIANRDWIGIITFVLISVIVFVIVWMSVITYLVCMNTKMRNTVPLTIQINTDQSTV